MVSRPKEQTPLWLHLLAVWVAALLGTAGACHASAGVTYHEFHHDAGPWQIQVVELDRRAASFRLGVD